jgi:WD40-like Beta Propeller Repeat
VVPYNARAGGISRALLGASDANYLEYEPTFSPDGKLIAFSRAPAGSADGPFRNRFGEVTVVATGGGTPAPLVANTPNVCAADSLPLTLLNGSPTWSPTVGHRGGRSYYFLLFTSARKYGDEFSSPFQIGGLYNAGNLRDSTQLYLTAVVVDDKTGSVTSYPAIYLWNQNRVAGADGVGVGTRYANMTPVWGSTELARLEIQPAK